MRKFLLVLATVVLLTAAQVSQSDFDGIVAATWSAAAGPLAGADAPPAIRAVGDAVAAAWQRFVDVGTHLLLART